MDQHNSANNPQSVAIPMEGGGTGHTTAGAKPVASGDRIRSIDAIRGVALLGILMMNIPGFGINWNFWQEMLTGPKTGADYYTFATVFTLFEGTMRGLFSMLFGAGMVLFMQNKESVPGGPSVAEYYYRRLLWLVLFGLFNAYILLWTGDILYFYGMLGMLLFPFRKFKPKWLIIIGLACMSITLLKGQLTWNEVRKQRKEHNEAKAAEKEKKELTPEQQGAIAAWTERENNRKPDSTYYNPNLRIRQQGSYGKIFNHFIPMNAGGETWWLYHGAWDMLMMMFIGMGLYLLGFFSNKLRTSTYVMWLLIGYGLGIPIAWTYVEAMFASSVDFNNYVDSMRVSYETLEEFRRLLLTIGHASLVMLVFRSGFVPWLMRALANVGQMAFTNYLMQSIICTFYFHGYGFGNYDKLRFHQLYYVVGSVWLFQLIFSSIWLRYFRFGPFEWLWRSLTYWKKQPMKK